MEEKLWTIEAPVELRTVIQMVQSLVSFQWKKKIFLLWPSGNCHGKPRKVK